MCGLAVHTRGHAWSLKFDALLCGDRQQLAHKPWQAPKPGRPPMRDSIKAGMKRAMAQLDFNRSDLLDWLPRSATLTAQQQEEAGGVGRGAFLC